MASVPTGYLFGNVDETGRVEISDLDQELIDTLEDNEYLNDILSGSFGVEAFDAAPGADAAARQAELIQPDADAIDYSDFNELADESALTLPGRFPPIARGAPVLPSAGTIRKDSRIDSYEEDDDYDIMNESATQNERHAENEVPMRELEPTSAAGDMIVLAPASASFDKSRLAELFPGYAEGNRNFSDIFAKRVPRTIKPFRNVVPKKVRDQFYEVAIDDRHTFHKRLALAPVPVVHVSQPSEESSSEADRGKVSRLSPEDEGFAKDTLPPSFAPVVLESWEAKIIWDDGDEAMNEPDAQTLKPGARRNHFTDEHHTLDSWEGSIVWDDEEQQVPTFSELVSVNPSRHKPRMVDSRTRILTKSGKMDLNKFNLSNDRYYEERKSVRLDAIRQTHGPAKLQHALPAVKLHPAYFKFHLAKKELRSFHRPSIKFPLNQEIHFSRVKVKKKTKGKDVSDVMKSASDITLKDTSKFILFEYSEEYPPMLNNPGMATLFRNYYRQIDESDQFVPQLENGQPFPINRMHESPFHKFGDIEPGQTLQVLENNMFHAPIFRQEVPSCDFLVVRHTFKNKTSYFIREIPNIYVVGQTFPEIEVPRPQSRKVTQAVKRRLQAVTYRLMRTDQYGRLKYDKLVKRFPFWTEPQLRQRLKEFAQFAKKGENTGWWKLKPGFKLLAEEDIQRSVTPEMVCSIESMLVGQQRLRDSGYADEAMQEENEEEDLPADADIELQLAPWTTTKNFIMAVTHKGMLQLYGPGDPTGRGEAFSYIRRSMKEMFLRPWENPEERNALMEDRKKYQHRFSIAEQQQVYKEEIRRIWNAQLRSLSSTEPPPLDDEEVEEQEKEIDRLKWRQRQMEESEEAERRRELGHGNAPATPMSPVSFSQNREREGGIDKYSDVDHEAQSVAGSQGSTLRSRILVIHRRARDPATGESVWKSEIVRDLRVIQAYVRERQMIERFGPSREGTPGGEEKPKKRKYERKKGKVKTQEGTPQIEEAGPSSVTLQIKAPRSESPAPPAVPVKRKRTESFSAGNPAADYLMPVHGKSYGRRRARPEVDLAKILENIINSLVAMPEAYEFCVPVSHEKVKDYYTIVKNPKTLEQIKDDVKDFHYKTASAFMDDVRLIAYNARLYNGPNHVLTDTAEKLVAKAQEQLAEASKPYPKTGTKSASC